MRILIDLQGAQSASQLRGIGRYSLSHALAMARNAGDHEIWVALSSAFPDSIITIRDAFDGLIPEERIRIFEVPTPVAECDVANAWRVRTAEKMREHFLHQIAPDVLHVSSLFEGYIDDAVTSISLNSSAICTAVTFYDLIPLLNQKNYLASDVQRKNYLRKVESLKNADLLLAISEATKKEAIEHLKVEPSQVINISAAADSRFLPLEFSAERTLYLQSKFGITRKIVLYAPGGFDQRKNFEGLIQAYSMLTRALRTDHQLVIVGNIGEERRAYLHGLAKQAGLSKEELIVTGYITDDELVDFYNLATLFVMPSTHEGFGLPALEAMACGAAVIGSNCTSIPEVIGCAEALFDPSSTTAIAERMQQALCDESFRVRLKTHSIQQARKFTWDECAERTIKAFEYLVSKNSKSNTVVSSTNDSMGKLIQSIAKISEEFKPTEADLIRVAECIAFNVSPSESKQLLLDISELVQRDAKTGIQRVVRSILRELTTNPPQNIEVRPIFFDGTLYRYANKFSAGWEGQADQELIDEVVDFRQDDIYLALDLNASLTPAVHHLHQRLQTLGIKVYFIVYDILLVQHPEWWPQGTSIIFEAWLKSISEVATGLICISAAVANEVSAWIKHNAIQRLSGPVVSSFHLGADVENSLPSKGLANNAQIVISEMEARPSFLMVGTLEPRKGHYQTLSAFELLWAQGVCANLVIVGKRGWLVEKLLEKLDRHPEMNNRLFWLEGISDEYLEKVYATSACLIAASEGEGFGLPLIEAAQHKKPIIARGLRVFREVAGEHAYYFDGLSPENLATTIKGWIELHQQNLHPKSEGMKYLSWRESALQLQDKLNLI